MKIFRESVLLLLLLTSLSFLCSAQKKESFDYPDEATTDSSKKEFVKQFNQGQVLYKLSCAKCHNKTVNGKEAIPVFSLPQLMDYEIRIFPEHMEKLTDNEVTDDEMTKIVAYLRYRKKKTP
jgi:cytochrome c553